MKRENILYVFLLTTLSFFASAQTIPYGTSIDSLVIITPPNTTLYEGSYTIYYYKPLTYDSLSSPIVFYVHALNGTGAQYVNFQTIADKRNALIIAPNMHIGTFGHAYATEILADSVSGCYHTMWMPEVFKQIYRHVLQRENRDSVPSYLTGFSAGGQFTTRYMLMRQFAPDSIPIRMAVSVSPMNYTFCTDTFNNTQMLWQPYKCGLAGWHYFTWGCTPVDTPLVKDFICNEHVIQYYNENYGVLIGTADTAAGSGFCSGQGNNRYDITKNFYNFSDTNAITRGTTLKWEYDSVIGIDHNANLMYNTKRSVTDTSTIAETLLFDTPWHPVPSLAPLASFTADTTIVSLPTAAVQFTNNSINATSYLWDFGDGTTSTAVNPTYIYTYADTFTVKLTAIGGSGCENTLTKKYYIIVKSASGVSENSTLNSQFSIYPNPVSGIFNVQMSGLGNVRINGIEIYNTLGQVVYEMDNVKWLMATGNTLTINHQPLTIDLSSHPNGIYFIELKTLSGVYHEKIIKK